MEVPNAAHVAGKEICGWHREGATAHYERSFRGKNTQKAFSTLSMAISISQLYCNLVTSFEQPQDAWDALVIYIMQTNCC